MDFANWVDEAQRFAEEVRKISGLMRFELDVSPPLPSHELREIGDRWPTGIPKTLEQLWTVGSERFHCIYVWEPPPAQLPELKAVFPQENYIYGGARFEAAKDIYPGNSGIEPGDPDMLEAIGDDAYRLWCETAVILHIGNGDVLALDQTADPEDPPVVYLSHDDESSAPIASSLTSFLESWAEVSYIGPEHWLLEYWLDDSTGLLDANKHMTQELRQLLNPNVK